MSEGVGGKRLITTRQMDNLGALTGWTRVVHNEITGGQNNRMRGAHSRLNIKKKNACASRCRTVSFFLF